MRGNLNENQAKIDNADKAVRAALERKRKIIMQSKQIAYDMLSELYGLEGQELVDAVTAEHTLIGKLTASGMTYEQIDELADDSSADKYGKQMSFSESNLPVSLSWGVFVCSKAALVVGYGWGMEIV